MINNVIAYKPLQCEGCGRNTELILHHWYNDNTHSETYYKYICESCNKFLETKTTNGLNHVLPNWELQSSLVMARLSLTNILNEIPTLFSFSTSSVIKLNNGLTIKQLIPILHCYLMYDQTILILERWNNETTKGNLQYYVLKTTRFNDWSNIGLPELLLAISHYNISLDNYNTSLLQFGRQLNELKSLISIYLLNYTSFTSIDIRRMNDERYQKNMGKA